VTASAISTSAGSKSILGVAILQKTLVVFATFSLVACGGSNSSSDRVGASGAGGEIQDGRVVDSPVAGLDYFSEGVERSLTDNNGAFRYRENVPVTFSIGDLVLGKTAGNRVLTPMDLVPGAREAQAAGMPFDEVYDNFPAVLNIARFLQTLDVDLDASNGRSIPPDAKALVSSYVGKIDFSSNELFAGDTSSAVEYICEVKRKRGPERCDASIVVSEESASEELTKTEETKASGARENSLPSAVGGDDQSVIEGHNVALSGTASDSDGSIVRVEWFESDVNGIRKAGGVAIQGKGTLEARFTAPAVSSDQLIYLALDVEDNDGGFGTDVVHILVKSDNGTTDLPPTADAGSDQTVSPNDTVLLDGAGSSDPEGATASYSWAQVDENGNVVTDGLVIQNANEAQASFVAPDVIENTAFLFRLTVTDSQAQSDSDLVNVTVEVSSENSAPVADAGADQSVEAGAIVRLDGSGSSDANEDTLTYAWTQIEGPSVELSDSNSATPQFEAPSVEESTTLRFSLTVSDGQLSNADVTDVTVSPSPSPVLGCIPFDFATYEQCESSLRALCSSNDLPEELCESPLPVRPSVDGFTAQILFPNMLSDQSEGELPVAPGLVVVPSDDGAIVVSVQAFEQVGVEYGVRTNDLSLVVTTTGDDSSQKTYNASDYASVEKERVVFRIPLEELPQAEQASGTRGTNGFVFTVNDNGSRKSRHFVPKEMLLYRASENAELADALDGEYFTENGPAYTPVIVMGVGAFGLINGGLEGNANAPVEYDPVNHPGLYRTSALDGSWLTSFRLGNKPIPDAGHFNSQAITLFAINEQPTAWKVLGNVTAKAYWGTYFSDINKISFFYRTQNAGQQVGSDARFQIYMSLDNDADGKRDACVISYLNDLRVGNTGNWEELFLDRNSGFGGEVTADCGGPSTKVTLAQLQSQYPNARVMSLSVQVVGSATPDAEMYVDDLSLKSIVQDGASVDINDPSARPEGGYSGSYKRSNPEFDEGAGSVLQWDRGGAGMSYDVVIEPRHDFSGPVIRYQWRAVGCPVNSDMPPSRVQPRAFIAREPAPGGYCSDSACREKHGTYQSTLTDGSALNGWNQFDWATASPDGSAPSGSASAHLVAMIVDDLGDCAVVQMRCLEVAGSGTSSSDYHRAFWNDEQCEPTVSP
jgi:hypothetical protein